LLFRSLFRFSGSSGDFRVSALPATAFKFFRPAFPFYVPGPLEESFSPGPSTFHLKAKDKKSFGPREFVLPEFDFLLTFADTHQVFSSSIGSPCFHFLANVMVV